MNDDAQDIGIRFAAQLLGAEIADGPPPEGSKLARLLDLEQELAAGRIDEAELMRRARGL